MDFDKIINRKHSNSLKWDGADRLLHKNSSMMWENSNAIQLPDDFIPMWAADMDFAAPREVLAKLKERIDHSVLGYSIRPESYHLALVAWLKQRHQWICNPDWMLYCPGVLPAINLAIDAYSQKGDKVVIQPPVYYRFSQAIEQHEREIVTNPLVIKGGKYCMDFNHLESCFKSGGIKLLILCNPHNPIGQCWSFETLSELAKLCIKYQVIVISDEIHSDLILGGNKHVPLASLSEEIAALTVTCLAPSKTFNLAGLRTAAVVIPDGIQRNKMQEVISRYGLDVSNVFGLIAFEIAYREGGVWLSALLKYLQENVAILKEYTERWEGVTMFQPQATHMVWLDFRQSKLVSANLKEELIHSARVGLSDGKTYFGKEGEGFQRINIGCTKATLKEALNRIERIL